MNKLNWQGFQLRDYSVMLGIVLISSYMGIAPNGFLGSVVYCVLVHRNYTLWQIESEK